MNARPNFFIVGAAKSGTTTLAYMLAKHPQLYFSPIKEPNYFSEDINPDTFKRDYRNRTVFVTDAYFRSLPLKELHLSFVRSESHYMKLFDAALDEIAIGEASTTYLYSKVAAKNIHDFNREAKIIAILRNPGSRAYSHYLMGLRFGYTRLPFRQAFELDMKETEKGWGISKLYMELGMYYNQLKRYYDVFPASQIRIYLFEELEADTQVLFNDLCSFLEIEQLPLSEMKKQNEALLPKYPLINKLLSNTGLRGLTESLISVSFKKKMKQLLFQDTNIPSLGEEDRKFLQDVYREDIIQTSRLIGKDLSHWIE